MKKATCAILVLLSFGCLPVFGQEKVIEKFSKAIFSGNEEEMRSMCTEHFWDNPYGHTGKKIYLASLKKKYTLERKEKETNKDRVVYHVLRHIKGENPVEIYFYMLQQGETYLIDGIDEDENHIPYFLDEKIGGHFEPEHLDEHEGLHALGEQLIAAAEGDDVDLSQWVTGDIETYIDLLKDVEDVDLEKARYSESLDKGVVHFIHMFYEDHEDLSIYFHYKGGKWEAYTYSFHAPHSKDFYRNKIDE